MRKTPEDVEKFCKNPDGAKITGKTFADLRYLPAICSTDLVIDYTALFPFCLLHRDFLTCFYFIDTKVARLYHQHDRRIILSPSANPHLRRSPLRL